MAFIGGQVNHYSVIPKCKGPDFLLKMLRLGSRVTDLHKKNVRNGINIRDFDSNKFCTGVE